MNTKICKHCGEEKQLCELKQFKNKTRIGYRNMCKECYNSTVKIKYYKKKDKTPLTDKQKEYHKEYRLKNKERIKERDRNKHKSEKVKKRNKHYHIKNKEIIKQKRKVHYQLNKDSIKQYREKNKKRRNELLQLKRKQEPLWQLKNNVRNLIYQAIVGRNFSSIKGKRTEDVLGCSFEEFKVHLESKFEPWMSWDNHGKYNGELNFGWDIDHIIPLASATSLDEVIILSHYTNLQPLCSYTNRYIKKDKL